MLRSNESGDSDYFGIFKGEILKLTIGLCPSEIGHKWPLLLKKHEQKQYKNFSQEWYVFGNDLPIHKDTIRRRKNANCKEAGVKQIRVHDFRHSCASFLINYGASITLVAKYLGHTKIDETLNTYSHMYQNKLEDIVKLINQKC